MSNRLSPNERSSVINALSEVVTPSSATWRSSWNPFVKRPATGNSRSWNPLVKQPATGVAKPKTKEEHWLVALLKT